MDFVSFASRLDRSIKTPDSGIDGCFSSITKRVVSATGFEPVTQWLKVTCSTNWATRPYIWLTKVLIRTSDPGTSLVTFPVLPKAWICVNLYLTIDSLFFGLWYGFACGRRVFGVWLDFGPVTFGFRASDIRNYSSAKACSLVSSLRRSHPCPKCSKLDNDR